MAPHYDNPVTASSKDLDPDGEPPVIDTTVAHTARRYDYWLGGKTNFAADRESGDAIAAAFPNIRTAVVENRRFVNRAVAYLAREAGIRQFLDIGTGIPTSPNVHEIAQEAAPAARIVYVDNDPIVLAHARALLRSTREGATAYIDADLRDPDAILANPKLRDTLDFSRPVVLILASILHFVSDTEDPYDIVARLVGPLPRGSYLAIAHASSDYFTPEQTAGVAAGKFGNFHARSEAEFARFFEGFELVPPGITSVAQWRADAEPLPRPAPAEAGVHCAVARIS